MFDFINLMTVFVINRSIHSYVIPHTKAKMSRFGLNTLHYDGANLLKEFFYVLLYRELNLAIAKREKLLQICFLDTRT